MPQEQDLIITSAIRIPQSELEMSFVRSSGPGGQHVNKTSTQVEVTFDLLHSSSIPEIDRQRMLAKLQSKLDSEGRLRVTAQESRSQLSNRKAALEKLTLLLKEAARKPKPRKKTKPSKASVEKRLDSKKKHSDAKKNRSMKF